MHFTTLYNIRGVSIITSMAEYDFFPYTCFCFLYSFDREICCRWMKLSGNFKVLKYTHFNRLWDQRKQTMTSDGQKMKSSCFCKLVWSTKLKKNMKDSAGKA